jgi:membrane associated rhomboid family serine protease
MDLSNWAEQLSQLMSASQQQLGLTFEIVGLLWIVQIVNSLLGYRLNLLGIWPRKIYGIPGIVFAPFLHGNYGHLFFNSIPLLILIDLLLISGFHFFLVLTLFIMIISGVAIWLLARPGVHVGASSVLMGYWGFLLMQSYFHPSVASIIVAILCIYYLSSLFLSLFPSGPQVSWEGHVFGCAAGIIGAFIFQASVQAPAAV